MFSNPMFGLLYDARREWREISREPEETITQVYVKHALLLAMIPPFALFTGTTQMGWSFAGQDLVFLSIGSAAAIAVAFYISLLLGLALMSFIIHSLEHAFGTTTSYERCLLLTVYTATPMFLAGAAGFFPVFWFDAIVVGIAAMYSLHLLFTGVPVFMDIPESKGAMFSFMVMTAGMCMLVGGMAITVILWGLGMSPQYILS